MAEMTTCLLVWACINYHVSVTHYKRPYGAHISGNRSALGSVLPPGASNRDDTVGKLINKISKVTVLVLNVIWH